MIKAKMVNEVILIHQIMNDFSCSTRCFCQDVFEKVFKHQAKPNS